MLDAFGWSLVFPNNILDILDSLFLGHPSHGVKSTLWLAMNTAFGIFCVKGMEAFSGSFSLYLILDRMLFYTLYWCKHKHPFNDSSLSIFPLDFQLKNPFVVLLLVMRVFFLTLSFVYK